MDSRLVLIFLSGVVFAVAEEFVPSFCLCKKYEVHCDMPEDANSNGLTYQEYAADQCAQRGGYLANLVDSEIDTMVKNFIYDKGLDEPPCIEDYGFFIGLSDVTIESTYVWSNGNPICRGSFTNWAPGEPNNLKTKDPNGQDCVQLWYRLGHNGLWADEYCNYRPKGYICEIPNHCCCSEAPMVWK